MKTNNLHHPTYPQWVNGLATLALVAAGMTLWWVTTASQMENRVSPVSPQSQLSSLRLLRLSPRERLEPRFIMDQ